MSWTVHPHGPLVSLAPGLWSVRGSLPRSSVPRNMILWRAPEGLLVHSPVCCDEATMSAIEALGPIRWIIVPNRIHRTDAAAWRARYPDAQMLAPRAVVPKAEEVVKVDATCEDVLPGLGVVVHAPDGAGNFELAYELPLQAGRALVVTDLLFHLDHLTGFSGVVLRYVTASTGFFGVTRIGRWFVLADARAYAGWLRRIADAPPTLICVAHGEPLTSNVPERLREAAARLG